MHMQAYNFSQRYFFLSFIIPQGKKKFSRVILEKVIYPFSPKVNKICKSIRMKGVYYI